MADYINRVEAIVAALDGADEWDGGYSLTRNIYIERAVNQVPAADVVDVVHGHWESSDKYKGYMTCSECHDCYVEAERIYGLKWRYCPDCGAKMRPTSMSGANGGDHDAPD